MEKITRGDHLTIVDMYGGTWTWKWKSATMRNDTQNSRARRRGAHDAGSTHIPPSSAFPKRHPSDIDGSAAPRFFPSQKYSKIARAFSRWVNGAKNSTPRLDRYDYGIVVDGIPRHKLTKKTRNHYLSQSHQKVFDVRDRIRPMGLAEYTSHFDEEDTFYYISSILSPDRSLLLCFDIDVHDDSQTPQDAQDASQWLQDVILGGRCFSNLSSKSGGIHLFFYFDHDIILSDNPEFCDAEVEDQVHLRRHLLDWAKCVNEQAKKAGLKATIELKALPAIIRTYVQWQDVKVMKSGSWTSTRRPVRCIEYVKDGTLVKLPRLKNEIDFEALKSSVHIDSSIINSFLEQQQQQQQQQQKQPPKAALEFSGENPHSVSSTMQTTPPPTPLYTRDRLVNDRVNDRDGFVRKRLIYIELAKKMGRRPAEMEFLQYYNANCVRNPGKSASHRDDVLRRVWTWMSENWRQSTSGEFYPQDYDWVVPPSDSESATWLTKIVCYLSATPDDTQTKTKWATLGIERIRKFAQDLQKKGVIPKFQLGNGCISKIRSYCETMGYVEKIDEYVWTGSKSTGRSRKLIPGPNHTLRSDFIKIYGKRIAESTGCVEAIVDMPAPQIDAEMIMECFDAVATEPQDAPGSTEREKTTCDTDLVLKNAQDVIVEVLAELFGGSDDGHAGDDDTHAHCGAESGPDPGADTEMVLDPQENLDEPTGQASICETTDAEGGTETHRRTAVGSTDPVLQT